MSRVRLDKIIVFLVDEAQEYQDLVEQELSQLLPHLEIDTRLVDWNTYTAIAPSITDIYFQLLIHRAKIQTKVVSFMKYGNDWANRPCQCQTAKLVDKETATLILSGLVKKSIGRVVGDFLGSTHYI